MFPDTGNGNGSEASTSTDALSPRCCQFKFDEILLATDNFNESLVVGKGGFGKVYKANIRIGTTHVDVAIKRLDLMSNQGAKEFWAEVEMLSKLRHAHLVSLIGYSNYEKEMILVYEYMPHGTLANHLHKLHTPLSWLERLKICIGAARGLDYLHTCTGIDVGVIHRDVKSSNILLHESWAAKISDFGLARIVPTNQSSTHVNTLVKGTFGYIDPNYFATGKLTRKSDVYAFGVVLFEVLCQKRPLDESFECGLATWIQESIKEGNLKQIVYSGIRSEISPKCLKGFAQIAKRCLDNHPNQRPTMTEVVFNLESLLSSQQKTNNSLQTPGIPISRGENSVEADDNSEDDDVDEDVDTPLPTVKDLQIWGEAFPGHEIVAAGYSINGTTRCVFKWVRHLRDGSVNCIQYATNPAYTVSADDVGNHLAVEVQPLDDRQRKGKLVTCFANELKEITCHPNMVHVIEKTLSVGHVSFQLMAWNRSLDTWEPAILEIKKSSYSIKLYGSNNSVVIVDSKYTPTMLISLEADIPFQFSILGPGGVEHFLCADFNSTDISCSRDTIVLTMRLFVRRATLGRRKGGLCFS